MGCDIHPIIERHDVRRNSDGEVYWREWVNAGTPDLGRDYELFAALAGVRNRDGVKPASEPRGLPGEQPCQEFQAYYREWEAGAHSASWLTLAEVKAYDTTQRIDDRSIIMERDSTGQVLATCRGTNRPGPYEHVGPRRIFASPFAGDGGPTAWDLLIAEMERAKRDGDTDDDIRLVFFFDN